jgi:LuxR family maltose regulon positive regulatory protein
MLAIAEGDYAAAEPLLLAARDEQARHTGGRLASDARVLLPHLYRVWGRPDEALAALAPALEAMAADDTPGFLLLEGAPVAGPLLRLALERGVGGPFVARALALLDAAFPAPAAAASPFAPRPPSLPEPLTPREVEVLRLLAAGASNQAIAEALVISLHTVKRHVTNLHQKLGVGSRLEAVARARELGLV